MTSPSIIKDHYDIAIIGGGINGVGIARDAAGRGLSVLLIEKGDLGGATSSRSSKLIHGGLRYLEHFAFGLVRKALKERDILLNSAPHIIWPLPFILPHHAALRSAPFIRAGLFLYDHLYHSNVLPGSHQIDLLSDQGLQAQYTKGFRYFDCWVQDARLVILNAIAAKENNATILPYSTVTRCMPMEQGWKIQFEQQGKSAYSHASVLINASGPWANIVLEETCQIAPSGPLSLVKGSHIIVKKCFNHDNAYIFQNADKRVIFMLPFEQHFTLIGTTDVPYKGALNHVDISNEETHYLLKAVNQYLNTALNSSDIIHSYAGIRPLYDSNTKDASSLNRDYHLALNTDNPNAILLTVYGGKITTYRKLAEECLNKIANYLPKHRIAWTSNALLPGGDIKGGNPNNFANQLAQEFPFIDITILQRYAHNYGSLAYHFLSSIKTHSDLGQNHGHGLYDAEIDYLHSQEWAVTTEDILWRRTKLGLLFDKNKAIS